jgi:hypothetical protein
MKHTRNNSDYANQSQLNLLKVLRALIEAPSRGYTIKEVAVKAGVNYDQARRALLTMSIEPFRFARQFMGAWKPGDGLRILAARTDLAFTRQDNDVMKLADSMRQI